MSIEWFRDLSVVILCLVMTVTIIVILVLAFLAYRKLEPVMDSLKTTTENVEQISSCIKEGALKPLAHIASLVQGISQAIGIVNRFSKAKKRKE